MFIPYCRSGLLTTLSMSRHATRTQKRLAGGTMMILYDWGECAAAVTEWTNWMNHGVRWKETLSGVGGQACTGVATLAVWSKWQMNSTLEQRNFGWVKWVAGAQHSGVAKLRLRLLHSNGTTLASKSKRYVIVINI